VRHAGDDLSRLPALGANLPCKLKPRRHV
jgi:hypothetical protein